MLQDQDVVQDGLTKLNKKKKKIDKNKIRDKDPIIYALLDAASIEIDIDEKSCARTEDLLLEDLVIVTPLSSSFVDLKNQSVMMEHKINNLLILKSWCPQESSAKN